MDDGLYSWIRHPDANESPVEKTSIDPGRRSEPVPQLHGPEERFIAKSELGRGAGGAVMRVLDRNLDREVAMKLLDPDLAQHAPEADAIVREARTVARLDHPNVVPVHELGVDSKGRPFFVMRAVEGRTLFDRVHEADRAQSFEDRLHEDLLILLKVCDAVSFAHSRGVIHCDLKPQNVMIGDYGEVYVLDWGLARRKDEPPALVDDATRCVLGTPAYMPPEQARGRLDQVDERSDVFGIGSLLYFVLTGRGPFLSETAEEAIALAAACRMEDAELASRRVLPSAVLEATRKALAERREDRFESVRLFRRALERCLSGGLGTHVWTYAPGTMIVREGDPGDAAFIIARGRCRAQRTDDNGDVQVLREMGPGDVFGEMAVILSGTRTASVVAIDEVTAHVVTQAQLEEGLDHFPWLRMIVRTLTERFKDLDAKLAAAQRK